MLEEEDDGQEIDMMSSIRLQDSEEDMREVQDEEMGEEQRKIKLKELEQKFWENKKKYEVNMEESNNFGQVVND